MKYTVDVEVPEKQVLKQAHFFVPEPIYREFAFVAKDRGIPMSRVIVEFMKKFAAEHYRIRANQTEMF